MQDVMGSKDCICAYVMHGVRIVRRRVVELGSAWPCIRIDSSINEEAPDLLLAPCSMAMPTRSDHSRSEHGICLNLIAA
jgi:hypothetical protein